jgi:exonuclease V gamma subunit
MNIFLFDSHSLEALSAELFSQLRNDKATFFSNSMVVIPHPSMKEWLQIQLCNQSKNGSISSLNFVGWRKAIQVLSGANYFPTRAEIAAAIWQQLEISPLEICKQFFESENKAVDFVGHLASLFSEYGEYGLPETISESMIWQKNLFETVFRNHKWLTANQSLETLYPQRTTPVYLFGMDLLPPAVYRYFLRCEQVRIFRFSPCAMFWEDMFSSRERKKIVKNWEKKQVSPLQLQALDELLSDTQPLLANWGKLGRKMLALAPAVTAENYELDDSGTLLNGLKVDLLLSMQDHRELSADSSLRCLRTGSSRLHEVRVLQMEILKLAEEGIPYSEIRVYAPNMDLYAPFIEFCFSDPTKQIPFRIAGVDIARKSPFYQALLTIFLCVNGRWEVDTLLSLFEMPTFYRKAGWKMEEVERIASWAKQAGVRWGIDKAHRLEQTGVESNTGSWEAGFDCLLDSWIYLQPEKEHSIGWSDSELFQKFYEVFSALKAMVISWRQSRSFAEWAVEIQGCVATYLFVDGSCTGDQSAEKGVDQLLDQLRVAAVGFGPAQFPFSFVEAFFFSEIKGELGGASLHSVRFSSIELGMVLPARAIFVMGMDEEHFPRSSPHSSLRLNTHMFVTQPDLDRHLFLSLIFAAKERLVFSYGHQSPDDGKLVSPSLLVQELLGYLSQCTEETSSSIPEIARLKPTSLLTTSPSLPALISTFNTIGLQELSRFLKNPFQHFLKMSLGISLKEETESSWDEFEFSSLTHYLLQRASLEDQQPRDLKMPLGLFGEVAKNKVESELKVFAKSLEAFGLDPLSIHTVALNTGQVMGEASLAVPEGALHLGSDQAASVLRRWVEILAILTVKGTNKLFFLKTGKVKEIADPVGSLQAIIELYLRAKNGPLFLHPDWVDPLLRKGKSPTIDDSEDPVVRWVLSRSPAFDLKEEKQIWEGPLQTAFASLLSLYPTRGGSNHGEI